MNFLNVAIGVVCAWAVPLSAFAGAATKPVVLVQLFTSEGCSSCPPADALLGEYSAASPVEGVTVVPMSLHVDYWNHLGWRDPFSAKQFSDWQGRYQAALRTQSIYTPQMIVDGHAEFVGSDRDAAKQAVAAAARIPKADVSIDARLQDGGEVVVKIDIGHRDALPADQKFDVNVAITEDGLSSDILRGENAGRKLQHSAVLRSLSSAAVVTATDSASIATRLKLDPSWKPQHVHVVAFIQSQKDLQVYGASAVDLGSPK